MTTGGGRGFVETAAGSITATPSWVGNQSVPSRASMPAGQSAAVALDVEHAVAPAVRDRRDLSSFAGGELVELLLAHAGDAAIAAHPEVSAPVFEDLEDAVVEQAGARGVVREPALLQARQAAVVGADPEDAVVVFVHGSHDAARQAIVLGPARQPAVLPPGQPAGAANPHAPGGLRFDNHPHVVGRQAVARREQRRRAVLMAHEAMLRPEPEHAGPVLMHRPDHRARGNDVGRDGREPAVPEASAAAPVGGDPQAPLPVLVEGRQASSAPVHPWRCSS